MIQDDHELCTVSELYTMFHYRDDQELIAIISVAREDLYVTARCKCIRVVAMWDNDKLPIRPGIYIVLSPKQLSILDRMNTLYHQQYYGVIIYNEEHEIHTSFRTISYHRTKIIKLPQLVLNHLGWGPYHDDVIDLSPEHLDTRNRHHHTNE
jgi:hypothetical protein